MPPKPKPEIIVKENKLYCHVHKDFFKSSKYAFQGNLPQQCNVCKSPNWKYPKRR